MSELPGSNSTCGSACEIRLHLRFDARRQARFVRGREFPGRFLGYIRILPSDVVDDLGLQGGILGRPKALRVLRHLLKLRGNQPEDGLLLGIGLLVGRKQHVVGIDLALPRRLLRIRLFIHRARQQSCLPNEPEIEFLVSH